LTAFSIAYVLTDTGTPTDEQFQAAADVTAAYIDEYTTAFFDFSLDTDLDSVTTAIGDFAPDPIEIGYSVTMDFAETSVFIPSKGELDNLMFSAFQEPAVQALLTLLNSLPDNPFASATSATYTPTAPTEEAMAEESVSSGDLSSNALSPVSMAAIAIGCLLVASVSGLYWVKRRHYRPKKYMPAHGENGPDLPTTIAEDTMGSECSYTSSLLFSKTSLQRISEEDKDHSSDQKSPLCSSSRPPARRKTSASGNSTGTPGTEKQKVNKDIYDNEDADDAVRSCQGMGTFQQDVDDTTADNNDDDDGHDDIVEKAVLLARSRRNASDGSNERRSGGPSYL
jgi:hypothetical protein